MANLYIGDSARIDFVATLSDGSLIDITGAKLYCQVRTSPGATTAIITKKNGAAGGSDSQAVATNATQGRWSVYIQPADSALLGDMQTYVYDGVVILTSTDTYTSGGGQFVAQKRVTVPA